MKMNMTQLTKSILVSVVVASLSTSASGQQERPPAKVEILEAKELMLTPQLEVPGTVVSRNDSQIAAEVSGRVAWVAEVGTFLQAGEVIAKIEDRSLQLQIREADANVKRLQASVSYLEKEVTRSKELAKRGNVSVSRLDEMVSRRDMTRQELAQAKVAYERIEYDLERTQVVAPFPGRVVERLIQVGEFSSVGRAVARFVDTQNVEIRAMVPVKVAPFLSEGTEVDVAYGGIHRATEVRAIIPVGDEISRMFEIRVSLPASEWIVGSAVRVAVPNAMPEQVVAVHRDALVVRANSVAVFKVGLDNKAERIEVKTGAGRGDFIAISGLIKPGEMIVIRGAERLEAGQDLDFSEIA